MLAVLVVQLSTLQQVSRLTSAPRQLPQYSCLQPVHSPQTSTALGMEPLTNRQLVHSHQISQRRVQQQHFYLQPQALHLRLILRVQAQPMNRQPATLPQTFQRQVMELPLNLQRVH